MTEIFDNIRGIYDFSLPCEPPRPNRYFHRVIGLPPRKYLSLARARAALTSYLADRRRFSPEAYPFPHPSYI